MPNRPAPPLALRAGEYEDLRRIAGCDDAELARRARIVLLAHDGLANVRIAEQLGTSVPTVRLWRARYAQGGLHALDDRTTSRAQRRRIAMATRVD